MRKIFARFLACFIFSEKRRKAFRKRMMSGKGASLTSVAPAESGETSSVACPALKQYKQDNFIVQHPENKKSILYLYTSNTSNMGDLWSSPKNYFYFNAKTEEADIVKKFNSTASIDNDVIILGGGIHP